MVLSNENEQGSMLGSNARYSFGDGILGNVLILTEHQSVSAMNVLPTVKPEKFKIFYGSVRRSTRK
jgi:hypothetical protein